MIPRSVDTKIPEYTLHHLYAQREYQRVLDLARHELELELRVTGPKDQNIARIRELLDLGMRSAIKARQFAPGVELAETSRSKVRVAHATCGADRSNLCPEQWATTPGLALAAAEVFLAADRPVPLSHEFHDPDHQDAKAILDFFRHFSE